MNKPNLSRNSPFAEPIKFGVRRAKLAYPCLYMQVNSDSPVSRSELTCVSIVSFLSLFSMTQKEIVLKASPSPDGLSDIENGLFSNLRVTIAKIWYSFARSTGSTRARTRRTPRLPPAEAEGAEGERSNRGRDKSASQGQGCQTKEKLKFFRTVFTDRLAKRRI
jgi:hypothetical protein